MSLRAPLPSSSRARDERVGDLFQHSNLGHSDEPKRDQESNCHTLSLNISRQATALGEQILNHDRPSGSE